MTTFTWEGRQYQFTRLQQGYPNSPVIAHKLLTQDIHTQHTQTIISYIDDILIYVGNLQEQMKVKIDNYISYTQRMDSQPR